MDSEYVFIQSLILFLTSRFSAAGTEDVDNTPWALLKDLPVTLLRNESVNGSETSQNDGFNGGNTDLPPCDESLLADDTSRSRPGAETENNMDVKMGLDQVGLEGLERCHVPLMEYSHTELVTDTIRVSCTGFDPCHGSSIPCFRIVSQSLGQKWTNAG